MHRFRLRVYYEDTDMAGIVYHANYLRYIERARSDWVRDMGIDQLAMKAEGVVFAVRRVEAEYLRPARFDDTLDVETTLIHMTPARMVMRQKVRRDDHLLFTADVTIACLGAGGKPTRLPAELRSMPISAPS
ncbi:tol-pal system-associated acyl-CoA thioesterase [Roseobacter sp.]|uniref:tol-pal system-associated acyl-CoA thioesterase n=1 Tax=Roseobacter sp. TaxID=1907202 RepID=UPI002965E973|nr:tol-pal system-associated acyl-CoA thioesterase [Roseobacter sp.]MDW3183681.1 tol-pal system-associated acyl-CoA thioesterase [Roseobacter sp.]